MTGSREGRRSRLLALALAIGLLGLVGYAATRVGPFAPVRVTVARVVESRVQPSLFGIGTVEARRAFMVGPTVAGRVLAVHVDVGDRVVRGQVLADIDPVDLDARVVALDASLARARSGLAAAEAQRADAIARRGLAEGNARRYRGLATQGFISSAALDGREQERASALAAERASAANVDAARHELDRLAAERAGLQRQRAALRLVAPDDALIVAREVEPGSTVVAGQAVLRLIDPTSLWVRLRLDQGRSAGVAEGLPARIVRRSQPDRPLAGTVARVERVADSVTEERIAQVAFDTPPSAVSTGELAEVTVELPASPAGPVLPAASLVRRDGGLGVWRLEAGEPRFVAVRVGAADLDGRVQVLAGVRAGDTVVAYSEKALAPETRIRIVDALVKGPR